MAGYRLEIGFGGGEHLLHRAIENPDVGFIGVEPFLNGMAKLVVEVEKRGLHNIRVFDQDATLLLRRLPVACLDEVALLYPDPWPKRGKRKRRFVSPESLSLIARALKPAGRFLFASDIDDYVGWTLARALREPGLAWDAAAAPDWTRPTTGGRHALRGEGAAGRPPADLPALQAGPDPAQGRARCPAHA